MNPQHDSGDMNSEAQDAQSTSPQTPCAVPVEKASPYVPEQGVSATEPPQDDFEHNLQALASGVFPEEHVSTPTGCDSTALDLALGLSFALCDSDVSDEDFDALLDAALCVSPQR
ncbi:uncharacterized protein LOC122250120 [Penaeus japonicus]|uniref:uncharacterized protein LOC122250120 n=1 Tax=Penaeus japonicus TaxID=27405 RepID=UPI001C70EA62|nr:uncharacterized protein LOC122250120 [Penaeus japonicus]